LLDDLAQQTCAGENDTGETRALFWFRAMLAVDGPLADQRIQWLLDTALASA
jgi:hypothetical protein